MQLHINTRAASNWACVMMTSDPSLETVEALLHAAVFFQVPG
jgi:hypothetical protein